MREEEATKGEHNVGRNEGGEMMAEGLVGGLLSSPSIPPSGSNGKKKWRSEGEGKKGGGLEEINEGHFMVYFCQL